MMRRIIVLKSSGWRPWWWPQQLWWSSGWGQPCIGVNPVPGSTLYQGQPCARVNPLLGSTTLLCWNWSEAAAVPVPVEVVGVCKVCSISQLRPTVFLKYKYSRRGQPLIGNSNNSSGSSWSVQRPAQISRLGRGLWQKAMTWMALKPCQSEAGEVDSRFADRPRVTNREGNNHNKKWIQF